MQNEKVSFDPFETPCVTRGRAAAITGVSVDAVEAAAARGLIRPQRTAAGQWLLTIADVQRLVDSFAHRRR